MRTRLSVVVSLLVAAAALWAQGPTTVRDLEKSAEDTPASSVRLEMYPTAEGRPVDDLQQADVEIFEDNVPQPLTSFVHVNGGGPGAPRLFVIYLDTYHLPLDVAAALRVPLVKFFDRLAGADDMVAMMTPDMAPGDVPVGRKSAVISDIMQDVTTWARRGHSVSGNDGKDDLYLQCYTGSRRAVADEMIERRHEMLALDALDNLATHLRRIGPERKAVVTVTDGWRIFTPNPSLGREETRSRMPSIFGGLGGRGGRGTGGRGGRGGSPRARDEGGASSSQMAECETDRSALAMLDDSIHLRRLVDDANRGTVTFYPVFASGVAPPQERKDEGGRRGGRDEERQPGVADRAATLRELADNTDGVAVVDEKGIDPALTRIAADLGSYYLLSYASTNTKLDGRFRAVAVRVKRPGVKVRARRGYRGLTAEEVGEGGAGSAALGSAVRAVRSDNSRETFRIRTAAWLPAETAGASVWIVGELDYRVRKELAWSAGASGDVVVLSADGKEIASHAVDVRPADGRFSVRLPDGGVQVPPGDYAVRVRLHPDADPATTVTETARVQVPKDPSLLGEPVLWRRGPSTGPQYMMTADPQYRRTERIRVELPTTSPAMPAARLLDRAGKALPVPVQVTTRQDAAGFRWVVVDLALAPMGFGDYAIEVTLGSAKQVAAFALVP